MTLLNARSSNNYNGYTDLRGLSPWLRAARVKRTAERASLMVRVTGEELSVRVLCPDISSVCTVKSFIRSLTRHHSRLSRSKLSNAYIQGNNYISIMSSSTPYSFITYIELANYAIIMREKRGDVLILSIFDEMS